jgi:hypothetical protein
MVVAAAGPGSSQTAPVNESVSLIRMDFPHEMGPLERPVVQFDHAKHTSALEREGCSRCHHEKDEKLTPKLSLTVGVTTRDDLVDAYHDSCMACHKERLQAGLPSGPLTCGECHKLRPAAASAQAPIRFDYSLHGRHALAYPDQCDACHHVLDEERDELVYVRGSEDGCRHCHGAVDDGDKLSLRNASHTNCIDCHRDRLAEEQEGGPVLCSGCHDPAAQRDIAVLEEVPRLMRGQPDASWIKTTEAGSRAVPFMHEAHEPRAFSCSGCHHASFKPCGECHGIAGGPDSGGVTLEDAYHRAMSGFSCIGCHTTDAARNDCAGCHGMPSQSDGSRSCAVCHRGPHGSSELEKAQPVFPAIVLDALPAVGDDFPETVEMDRLADEYEPANFPHNKIVKRLDEIIRSGELAVSFHSTTEIMCSGCHHQSPAGDRPPPCHNCHADRAEALRDKPALLAAYHRQCIGCHQRMAIGKEGCTDCHAYRGAQP